MSEIEAGVQKASGVKLTAPRSFLAETSLETRNPLGVLFSRFYLRANTMIFSVWFFCAARLFRPDILAWHYSRRARIFDSDVDWIYNTDNARRYSRVL
jgi:hypothetical protein